MRDTARVDAVIAVVEAAETSLGDHAYQHHLDAREGCMRCALHEALAALPQQAAGGKG